MAAARRDALQARCIRNVTASSASLPSLGEMGYAARMRFGPDELALLAQTKEIEIETAMPGGPAHRTIIWVVVDGDDAFIRSVQGSRPHAGIARPWRTPRSPSTPMIVALRARAVAAIDPESVRRTSDALVRKYTGRGGLEPMLEQDVLDTTLRLLPS